MIAQFRASRVKGKCHWPEITKEDGQWRHVLLWVDAAPLMQRVRVCYPAFPDDQTHQSLLESTIQQSKLEMRKIPST